jgi:hypothetical protein
MPAIRKNAKVPKIPGWKIATAAKNAMVRNTARIRTKSVISRSNRTLSLHSSRADHGAPVRSRLPIGNQLRYHIQLKHAEITDRLRANRRNCAPKGRSPALRRATNGSLHQSHRSRNQALPDDCQIGAILGSGLIKSTIQKLRRGKQRRDSYAPVCHSAWRWAGSPSTC